MPNAYIILAGILDWKPLLRRSRQTWVNDGKIYLMGFNGKLWAGLKWLSLGLELGCCTQGNSFSGFVQGGNCLD
jgi:hypothetical protein